LTKCWETPFQKAFAEEFTLKVLEFNPSLSYSVRDDFSIGGGLRLVYSEGVIKNDSAVATTDMEGDTVGFGYNVAMTYKPTSQMNLAVTYRSNIDLDEEGTATLYSGDTLIYDGDASVSVPLPAALNVAISQTWQDTFTLELLYERTYWSQYETLNFEGVPLPETPKNWKDTDTFRVGATIKMDNKITAMMGFAIDETPVPENTIGFELPDSDAKIFSMGFRYQQREDLSWGAAFLYDSKESRTINGFGTFDEGGAFLTTIGVAYEY
jgi:long-chain fatty acid transport protein